jgi:hypothetical protein
VAVREGLATLLAIAFIAAMAPVLVGLFPRLHIPQVVVLLTRRRDRRPAAAWQR